MSRREKRVMIGIDALLWLMVILPLTEWIPDIIDAYKNGFYFRKFAFGDRFFYTGLRAVTMYIDSTFTIWLWWPFLLVTIGYTVFLVEKLRGDSVISVAENINWFLRVKIKKDVIKNILVILGIAAFFVIIDWGMLIGGCAIDNIMGAFSFTFVSWLYPVIMGPVSYVLMRSVFTGVSAKKKIISIICAFPLHYLITEGALFTVYGDDGLGVMFLCLMIIAALAFLLVAVVAETLIRSIKDRVREFF